MKFAILGLLIVLLIGFFVVVWKAAKDWRWYNIVAVCVTMLLAVLFLFPTAGVLQSRSEWHQVKENLERQAAEAAAEQTEIKYGDPNNPAAGEGIDALTQKLAKLGIEAGRRWRNLRLQNVDNQTQTLTLIKPSGEEDAVLGVPDEAPAEGEGAADPLPLAPEGLVVFGFAETPNADQTLVPTFYLGEFRITAATPNQVSLVPTGPLEPAQLQRISNRQAPSWSLYELLPLDGHHPFIAEGSVPGDDNFFGRVDEELVKSLLGNRVDPATLQNYLRDGGRATPDDPPLSRWTEIEFLKTHRFDVDSPDTRGALEGGFFDNTGRALDARLQRGEEGMVEFKAGDQILVKEEAADQLVDEGIAKPLNRYYIRPLNDYRFILRHVRLRLAELANRKTELEFEMKVLQEAIEKSNGMLVANQDIKLKLEQDLAQFRVEREAIADYASKLRERIDATRADMVRLHRSNLELEKRLTELHRSIETKVNAVTVTSTP